MTNQRRPMSYEITLRQMSLLKKAYPEILAEVAGREGIRYDDASEVIASMATDWSFFNGPRKANGSGPTIAVSASLGTCRPQTALEKGYLRERNPGKGQDLLANYLTPEDPVTERRFHVRVSYSTTGTSPEDALRSFFDAVKTPAAMFAEIQEDGVEGVVEIDDAELARIAAEDTEGLPEEPEDTPAP